MHAVGQVLGAAVTTEVADAWGKVVLYIARAFIQRETEIYEEKLNKDNGWFGWKKFVVTDKRRDTDTIYTYVLTPADGSKIPKIGAGKYITLRFKNLPNQAEYTMRMYSISSQESNKISISVLLEKESGDIPGGVVSSHLRKNVTVGNEIEIGMPFGTVSIDNLDFKKSVVFISGGIGCTVSMSLLLDIFETKKFNNIYVIDCVHDGSSHAYRNKTVRLRHQHKDRLHYLRVYSKPREIDAIGIDYDISGRLNFETLKEFVKDDLLISYYIMCGPEGLIHNMRTALLKCGVTNDYIQFECFGPLSKALTQEDV